MTDINNILASLQAAKEAQERLPGALRQIEEQGNQIGKLQQTIVSREETIVSKNAKIDALEQKVREVTAERDDVSFRELEAQDRIAAMARSLKAILAEGESVLATVDNTFVRRADLEKQVKEATDKYDHMVNSNQMLQSELDTSNNAHKATGQQLADVGRELAEVKRTWTAPPAPQPEPVAEDSQWWGRSASVPAPQSPEVAAPADPTPSTPVQSDGSGTATTDVGSASDPAPTPEVTGSPEQVKYSGLPNRTTYRGYEVTYAPTGDVYHWSYETRQYEKVSN